MRSLTSMFKVNTYDPNKFKYTSLHLSCKTCQKLSGISNLNDKFVELTCDDETLAFINNCINSNWQLFKASYFRPWVSLYYNITESNAILGTGRMFLFPYC